MMIMTLLGHRQHTDNFSAFGSPYKIGRRNSMDWRCSRWVVVFLGGLCLCDGRDASAPQPPRSTQHLHPAVDINPLPAPPHVTMPTISKREMTAAVVRALRDVRHRFEDLEPQIYHAGARQTPGSPSWFMSVSHRATPESKNTSFHALMAEEATRHLVSAHKMSSQQSAYGLPIIDVRGTALSEGCPIMVDFPCQPGRYRAFNGYCNNVQNPGWGAAHTRYLRFLQPDYSDGVSGPREAHGGGFLPSAREVSLAIHREDPTSKNRHHHPHLMVLAATWAQFVSNDLAHTPTMSGFQGQRLKCCGVPLQVYHPECFPIRLPEGDPFYAKFSDRCQEYARSGIAPRVGCTLGPREQLNQVTSYLDASGVYGSSKEDADTLRTFRGGFLKSQPGPGKELLPSETSVADCRVSPGANTGKRCFRAGDQRANEQVVVTAVHTLWLREHNRLSRELSRINPHWNDEQLFQESRRIVGAMVQHITYSEFLPVILGFSAVDQYGLRTQASGFFTGYDIDMNGGMANAVAAAALWFIASLAPTTLHLYDIKGKKVGEKNMSDSFYSPLDLYNVGGLDQIIQGLLKGKAELEDEYINDVMVDRMFEDPKTGVGMDLAAQIIQQGRDHGLPGYNRWRKFCGLSEASRFQELADVIPQKTVSALQKVYKTVNDVDLFTGGLAEISREGALLGPTFTCLLGRQFHLIRRGDRYWYENDLPPSSFSIDQLNEIRKVTLARLICDNSDNLQSVQPSVFLQEDPFLNAPMHCDGDALRRMDLSKWRTAAPDVTVPPQVLRDAVERGRNELKAVRIREWELFRSHRTADPLSPVGTASGFNRPKRQALLISNTSLLLQFTSARVLELKDSERGGVVPRDLRELMEALPSIEVGEVVDLPRVFPCDEQTLPCDHTSPFRSTTGWCNNLRHADWGKALRAFARLLPPIYQDGLSKPRQLAKDGSQLPSPRLVSTSMHGDISAPHRRYTLMLMQYAQLLDHDLTHTPMNRGAGNSILDCRPCDASRTVHPECWPIPVPAGDHYFPTINKTTGKPACLSFTRSLPGQLTLGPREQMNQVTAFVDASHTYGSDVCEARKLRSFNGGKLNVTRHPVRGKDLMPTTTQNKECKSGSGLCFEAGDQRASEQPGLAVLHTVWLREHNRLTTELSKRNKHWSDERLYQEGRRILSAITQHVTFSEFLPRVLGWEAVHQHGLEPLSEGYFQEYDPECDPSVWNEFGAAAFRFGHSLLRPALPRKDGDLREKQPVLQLRDTFFNPDALYEAGMVDEVVRGLVTTPMETMDHFITEEVTNHLFERRGQPFSGMDLAALNVQRGRDHALQPYNQYRALCNLTRARDFSDLGGEMSPALVQRLRELYKSVDDIDLFPGGLAETALPGGLVGPTFACIIAMQFRKLRRCDRFWYESVDPLIRFNEAQLDSIRRVSLARLMCDNTDSVISVQRNLLDLPEPFLNPRVPCRSIPDLDLDLWNERVNCGVGSMSIGVGAADRISPCVMCTCTKEGPLCQSLRISNCYQLAQSFTTEAILQDHVCKVQCAFAFRALPRVTAHENNQLGFS